MEPGAVARAASTPKPTPSPTPSPSPTPVPVASGTTPGALDATFGTKGIVTLPLNVADGAESIAVQSNGDIVALAAVNSGEFAPVRLTPSGALDTSFGSGGEVLASFGSSGIGAVGNFAIDSSGNYVVVGTLATNVPSPPADPAFVARYTPNGTLDSTFGTGGMAFMGGNLSEVLIQPNGDILASGEQLEGGPPPPLVGATTDAAARSSPNSSRR